MAELAYDERATNFASTNTTLFATTGTGGADPVIAGLDVTVVGTGAAVMVEFFAPGVWQSAGTPVTAYFVVNGAVTAATSQYRNYTAGGVGEGGSMRRRVVLTNGVSYTFKVGVCGYAAGITQVTAGGASAGVIHLRVSD